MPKGYYSSKGLSTPTKYGQTMTLSPGGKDSIRYYDKGQDAQDLTLLLQPTAESIRNLVTAGGDLEIFYRMEFFLDSARHFCYTPPTEQPVNPLLFSLPLQGQCLPLRSDQFTLYVQRSDDDTFPGQFDVIASVSEGRPVLWTVTQEIVVAQGVTARFEVPAFARAFRMLGQPDAADTLTFIGPNGASVEQNLPVPQEVFVPVHPEGLFLDYTPNSVPINLLHQVSVQWEILT